MTHGGKRPGAGRKTGSLSTKTQEIVAAAAAEGYPAPDEDELARVYGTSSPGRIRRLLEHLERLGLIVVREEFGGGRTISVPALDGVPAE